MQLHQSALFGFTLQHHQHQHQQQLQLQPQISTYYNQRATASAAPPAHNEDVSASQRSRAPGDEPVPARTHSHTFTYKAAHAKNTHTHIHAAPPPPPPGAHACLCCTPSIQNSSAQLIVCLTPVRSCPLKSQRICKPFVFFFFLSSSVLPAMCGEQSSCGKKRREKEKQDAERMLQTRAERSSEPGPYREKQAERL